eukprot:5941990-Amphidinium_carterae.2
MLERRKKDIAFCALLSNGLRCLPFGCAVLALASWLGLCFCDDACFRLVGGGPILVLVSQ